MSIYLSKLLPALIYPVSLTFFILLAAISLWKKRKVQQCLLIAALLILMIAGNRWVAFSLARSLEWQYFPPEATPHADVIVLLGGGTVPNELPRQMAEVNSAGDRVIYTAKLYREGSAPHILLSGGNVDWKDNVESPAHQMQELLLFMGVPEDAVWLEPASRNTYENALEAYKYLHARNINRIILVTSAMHMPRALALFEAQGFTVIPFPVDYVVTFSNWDNLWSGFRFSTVLNLNPGADSISLTTNALKEYFGILYYSIRGWK